MATSIKGYSLCAYAADIITVVFLSLPCRTSYYYYDYTNI